MNPQSNNLQTDHLTFTRFIAAIIIVFFHFGVEAPPFNNSFFRPLLINGGLGVSYFFVLSGFVMMVAYGKKGDALNSKVYFKNRAARILPLYYTATLLLLVYYFIRINILKMPSVYYPNGSDTFLVGTLIQTWFPEKAGVFNPPAWSLSAEVFFYLMFPIIYNKIYRNISLKAFIATILIFFFLSQVIFHFLIFQWPDLKYYFYFQPLLRLNEFALGNALGAIFLLQKTPIRYSIYAVPILMILAIGFLHADIQAIDFHNGLFAIFFAPMLYFLTMSQGRTNRLFSKKPFVFLGEMSYGLYILQFPVYFFFTGTVTSLGYKINPPMFYVYLLILLIISALCHVWIEIPLRNRIRNGRSKKVSRYMF